MQTVTKLRFTLPSRARIVLSAVGLALLTTFGGSAVTIAAGAPETPATHTTSVTK